jgi:hypothetical protein
VSPPSGIATSEAGATVTFDGFGGPDDLVADVVTERVIARSFGMDTR